MTSRKVVSLCLALSFIVLFVTGILSYFQEYERSTATLHTVFGILFSVGVLFHLRNNFRPLIKYARGRPILLIAGLSAIFILGAYHQLTPFTELMDYGARKKATTTKELNQGTYEILEMHSSGDIRLTIDLLRGEHYWHPQMAIWIEDLKGNYIETLFISKATARGLFFGGRSKENFKTFDENKKASTEYRRVNALPVWSHQRNVIYEDGLYVPTRSNPLPDAITGATLEDNFKLKTATSALEAFKLRIEINVAFDDNEYYSEYDFPDDDIFHNGTGQLGQPSLIWEVGIDMSDKKNYYLMEVIGHGHHSGQNGSISQDLSTLTTAKQIVERIVVGVKRQGA